MSFSSKIQNPRYCN